uniref:Lipoprotein n=1 Tax=Panagrolaimus davidi TaxID=227884 RepID=A0A914R3F4_9BILA
MYKFLGLFAVFAVVFGCVPLGNGGNGDDGEILDTAITNNPTFEFSYSPPVEWTAPETGDPVAQQMKNIDIATAVAQKMIQIALLEAIVKQGVLPPRDIDYGLDSIKGQQINVAEDKTAAYPGDGIIESGVVANICDFTGPVPTAAVSSTAEPITCESLTPNIIKDQEFTIKNGPTLSGRQWKDIASKLETAFREENVRLDKSIKVSAN